MQKKCLKCDYVRTAADISPEYECPHCGAIYAKVEAMQQQLRMSVKHRPPNSEPEVTAKSANTNRKLLECTVCGKQISRTAEICPHCGEKCSNAKTSASALGMVSAGLGLAAVLMPYFAAVFLVPAAIICGFIAINKDQKRLGTIGIVLGLVGLMGIIYTSNKITKITSSIGGKSGEISLPQSINSEPPVVTRAEYDQIRVEMSYTEVRSIIGVSGEELSRSDIAGISTVMYSWTNSNGSTMNAMFQNGQLISKAQFGLP